MNDILIYGGIAGIIILVIIVVVMIIKSSSKKEKYCPCELRKRYDESRRCESKTCDEIEKPSYKETFFVTNAKDAKVTPQGTIAAPRIFTDGHMNTSFENVCKAITENKQLPCTGVVGAGKGNNFSTQFDAWRQVQEAQTSDPTSVKTQKELEDISKQVSANLGSDHDCMLSRAGATKAKVVLEPLGTAGVMDEYKTPERDRNHKIRMVSYAVQIPAFELDTNRINDSCTSGGSWAKGLSPSTTMNIAIGSGRNDEKSAIAPTQTEQVATSFSDQK